MAKYHPDTRFLTDYAAGSLPPSQAICVAAHLHYCPACCHKAEEMINLGSILFRQLTPMESCEDDFEALMNRIDALSEDDVESDTPTPQAEPPPVDRRNELPDVLGKITRDDLESLPWRQLGGSLRYTTLHIGDPERETTLMNIQAGGTIPRHDHRGDEITVVLKGSFSDQDDHYQPGDFIVRGCGEIHRPVASQDEDCLCLACLDAPLKMTNPVYRLLMPIFK